jgi:hypothetical protein
MCREFTETQENQWDRKSLGPRPEFTVIGGPLRHKWQPPPDSDWFTPEMPITLEAVRGGTGPD